MITFDTKYMFHDAVRVSLKSGEKVIGVIKDFDGTTIWLWPSEEIINDRQAYVVKENRLGLALDQITRVYPL